MAIVTAEAGTIWDMMKSPEAEGLKRWLRWHPSEIDACVEARGMSMPAPLRAEELSELKEAHRLWNADDATLNMIDRLGSPNARVVVAGQQPGILAGPLYSVYKAMGAVKLAASLGARHPNLQFVPVFWVASEDHDFPEVRKAIWPGARGEIVEMLIENPDWRPGRMVGTLKCGDVAEALSCQIRETTYETDFRKELLDLIADAYSSEKTWEDAFARLFLRLFAGTGIVLVSPLMNWVRRRGKSILLEEAKRAGESSRLVIERGEELKRAGLTAEVHRRQDAVNFFWIDEHDGRHPLRVSEEGILRGANAENDGAENGAQVLAANASELAKMIESAPASFSYNVVTRPMVQDSILPTVAQLVGPGEGAYFAQIEAVYQKFGVFSPVRYPRPQAVLIQKNVERTLEKYGLNVEEALSSDATRLAKRVLERDMKQGAVGDFVALRERQIAEIRALAAKFSDNKPIAAAIDKLIHGMEKGFDTLQDRILYHQHEDEGHLNQALVRVEHSLNPAGKPQERILNPLTPFAVNYGMGWIRELAERLSVDPTAGMQLIRFSEITAAK
jgi:bacillithiol biosynthesis cysteine-adding enzyme BshC